jgi:hypothetical protein
VAQVTPVNPRLDPELCNRCHLGSAVDPQCPARYHVRVIIMGSQRTAPSLCSACRGGAGELGL